MLPCYLRSLIYLYLTDRLEGVVVMGRKDSGGDKHFDVRDDYRRKIGTVLIFWWCVAIAGLHNQLSIIVHVNFVGNLKTALYITKTTAYICIGQQLAENDTFN